ncbi:MAG: hypothetical protein H0T62_05755 [Parachlamydiaceae bacterium]|nr:hypothetical protein [Parachlamydiaceae bacterium]
MAIKISNSQWITIVLITAVLMLVFLVFGGRAPRTQQPMNLPLDQAETPQSQMEAPTNAPEQGW